MVIYLCKINYLSLRQYYIHKLTNCKMNDLLKSANDISGLLEYTLSKDCSIHELGEKFCKVAYLSGRTNEIDKLNIFIEENKGLIHFYVPKEYKELSEFLFKVGQLYPEIPDRYFKLLEDYYCNPKYFDMLEDLLFDQYLLKLKLKKFDAGIRSIQNIDFSNQLLYDVFNAAMSNKNVVNEQVHYYDKSENLIKVMTYGSENIIRNVHIIVYLFNTIEEFSTSVDQIIGIKVRKEFFKKHMKDINPGWKYNDIIYSSLDQYTFDLFKQFVLEGQDTLKINSNSIEKFITESSLKWLIKINS